MFVPVIPAAWEAEAEGLYVQGLPGLRSTLQASLGHLVKALSLNCSRGCDTGGRTALGSATRAAKKYAIKIAKETTNSCGLRSQMKEPGPSTVAEIMPLGRGEAHPLYFI